MVRMKRTVSLLVCLFFGCTIYLATTAGPISVLASLPVQTSGSEIYATSCAACHGSDGRAKTAKGKRLGATDFTGEWNSSQERCLKLIAKGKGEMPAFKGKLTETQIREVYGYVLHFKR